MQSYSVNDLLAANALWQKNGANYEVVFNLNNQFYVCIIDDTDLAQHDPRLPAVVTHWLEQLSHETDIPLLSSADICTTLGFWENPHVFKGDEGDEIVVLSVSDINLQSTRTLSMEVVTAKLSYAGDVRYVSGKNDTYIGFERATLDKQFPDWLSRLSVVQGLAEENSSLLLNYVFTNKPAPLFKTAPLPDFDIS